MPSVNIVGGGLAGLAAAAALGSAGFAVDLFEARPFLGGRATSFPVSPGDDNSELIDNCQHVLLRCCVNLLDFYARLGVADRIRFHREFYFHRAGRTALETARAGRCPRRCTSRGRSCALRCLGAADKLAIARGLAALMREHRSGARIWTASPCSTGCAKSARPPRAIERFWRQVLVSAVNEELDRMAALHGFQVFWLGLLARRRFLRNGRSGGAARRTYTAPMPGSKTGQVRIPRAHAGGAHGRSETARCVRVCAGERCARRTITCARCRSSGSARWRPSWASTSAAFEHSPITGIHLWFDRPVTELPHATLLDRTIQWMFNKSEGRYLQFVVSASRSLVEMPRGGSDRAGAARAGGILSRGTRSQSSSAPTSLKKCGPRIRPRPGMESARPATPRPARPTFSWRAIGRAPAGRRPWKARCAAATSRPRP